MRKLLALFLGVIVFSSINVFAESTVKTAVDSTTVTYGTFNDGNVSFEYPKSFNVVSYKEGGYFSDDPVYINKNGQYLTNWGYSKEDKYKKIAFEIKYSPYINAGDYKYKNTTIEGIAESLSFDPQFKNVKKVKNKNGVVINYTEKNKHGIVTMKNQFIGRGVDDVVPNLIITLNKSFATNDDLKLYNAISKHMMNSFKVISSIQPSKIDYTESPTEKVDTDNLPYDNIYNDYIYFINPNIGLKSHQDRMFKVKMGESTATKLSERRASKIVKIKDDYIYFISGELYKVKIDGTDERKISKSEVSYDYKQDGSWLYWSSASGIYSLDLNTPSGEKLISPSNHFATLLTIKDDYIYYEIMNDKSGKNEVYKLKVDGSTNDKLLVLKEDDHISLYTFKIYGNYVYWINYGYGSDSFNRIGIDGTGYKVLIKFENQVANYKIAGNKIYLSEAYFPNIYMANMDGTGLQKIISSDGRLIYNFEVIDNYIYYMICYSDKSPALDNTLYKQKLNSTEKRQTIEKNMRIRGMDQKAFLYTYYPKDQQIHKINFDGTNKQTLK